ncbi:MAG: MFS transporter [Pseudomonadota bacterium]
MSHHWLYNRTLWLLLGCQVASVCGSVVIVSIGGLVGAELAPTPVWATLPVSLMVVGMATSAAPAALLMARVGRKPVFLAGILIASMSLLLAWYGMREASFGWFCVGLFGFGMNMACVHQYRFAAAESVAQRHAAGALSLILLGPVAGALIGPALLDTLRDGAAVAGTAPVFVGLAVVMIIAAILMGATHMLGRDSDAPPSHSAETSVRPPQLTIALAICAGVSAYAIMSLIMTATPINMHHVDGFDIGTTARVIRAHVIAMYLPSVVFATLIAWFGVRRLLFVGIVCYAAVLATALSGRGLGHYTIALVALGLGWNLLYLGGTYLITQSASGPGRFRLQALNEFAVFSISALASLAAGAVLYRFGWSYLLMAPIPFLAMMVVLLAGERRSAAPAVQT